MPLTRNYVLRLVNCLAEALNTVYRIPRMILIFLDSEAVEYEQLATDLIKWLTGADPGFG